MRKSTILICLAFSSSGFAFTAIEVIGNMVKKAPQFCSTIESESRPWLKSGAIAQAVPAANLRRAEDLLAVCIILGPEFTEEVAVKSDAAVKQDPIRGLATMMALSQSQCASPCLRLGVGIARAIGKGEAKEKDKLLAIVHKAKFPSYYTAFDEIQLIRTGLDRSLWSIDKESLAALNKLEADVKYSYDAYMKSASSSENAPDKASESPSPEFVKAEVAARQDSRKLLEQLHTVARKLK